MMIQKFTARLRQGGIDIGCIQDQGAREYQEDTVGFTELNGDEEAERFIAVVADGMGGMASGAFVSDYTVKNLLAAEIRTPQEFRSAVCRISGEIAAGGSRGGTTLAAVYILPEGVYFCSVGDSRIYLLRDGKLTRLTADQDYMSVLLDRVIDGKISWSQAEEDPECDALSQFVGSGMLLSPDMNYIPMEVSPGDRLLICSDGVYNALSDEEMRQALTLTTGGAAEDILGRILAHGYTNQDNFTAVVMQFPQDWEQSSEKCDNVPTEENAGLHIDSAFHTGKGGMTENRDALLCGRGIYVTADGAEGENGAKTARAAVDHISAHTGDSSPEGIRSLLEGASDAARRSGELSAVAAALVRDGVFTCGSMGGCRVYYFRGGRLLWKTCEQRCTERSFEFCEPVQALPGDAFLLFTDGFGEYIDGREMETDLIKSRSGAEWLRSMLKRHLLYSRDGGDNYTAVCGVISRETAVTVPQEEHTGHFPLRLIIPLAAVAVGIIAALIWLLWGR